MRKKNAKKNRNFSNMSTFTSCYTEKILLGVIMMLNLIFLVSALNISTSSYLINSTHLGGSGTGNISSGNYTGRDTITYQQAGTRNLQTTNYIANSGWFFVESIFVGEVVPFVPSIGGGGGGGRTTAPVEEPEKEIEVEEEILEQLFDVTFTLDNFLIHDVGELSGVVTFESFGTEPTPVNLTFILLDSSGKEIYREMSSITVTTEEILRWNYEGVRELSEGKYTVILETLYNVDVVDEFRQEFEIEGGMVNWFWIWIVGGIIIGIWVFGVVWWLIKNKSEEKGEKKTYEEFQGLSKLY